MRRYYIDNIRWGTIILVVLYHVIYMFNGIIPDGVIGPFHENQYQDALQYVLYPWFMVLLFLIAGMCSRYYLENHTIKEFVKSRTEKLLIPSTLGLFVWGWAQGYISMSISDAFQKLPDTMPKPTLFFIMVLSGTGVLWFIQLLWLFSMILTLVRRFEKGTLFSLGGKANCIACLFLVVPVYLSGLVLNAPVIVVYRFGIYGLTFFLGYFVFAHDEVIEKISRFRIPLLLAAIIACICYLLLHYGDNFSVAPTVNSIPAVLFLWFACLAILGCMYAWGNKNTPLTTFFTKKSFGLYVFHYLPLSATAYALHKYTRVPALPSYLLVGIAAFTGGLLLYEVISRIPIVRWFILGMKKKK